MSDAQFRARFVPQAYGDRVQRGAVLHPMFGVLRTDREIIKATLKLVRVWRRTLNKLREFDWSPRSSGDQAVAMQYARNCLPSFVACRPATATCCLRHICPFCYARTVRDVWDSLDLAFPNPNSPAPPETYVTITPADETHDARAARMPADQETRPDGEFPYWLIERRNEINVPFIPGDQVYIDLVAFLPRARTLAEQADGPGPKTRGTKIEERQARFALAAERRARDWPYFQENLQACLEDFVRVRQSLRRLPTLGMYGTTLIEPTAFGWHVEQRQLFMVTAGTRLDRAFADTRGKLTTHTQPTRKTIFQAVIRTCAFPPKLLFRDPALLALLLRTRKGFRLTATTGRFRNQAAVRELRRRDLL